VTSAAALGRQPIAAAPAERTIWNEIPLLLLAPPLAAETTKIATTMQMARVDPAMTEFLRT
jgi:hypothetical protein